MKLAHSITTNQGISVSLTVPTGRYRVIRRARLQRAVIPVQHKSHSFWTVLQTLLNPNAERTYARQQASRALTAEYQKYAVHRFPDGTAMPTTIHFP